MTGFLPLLDLPQRTIPELLDRSMLFGRDRLFLIDLANNSTLTYGQFLEHVSALAIELARRFAPGTMVAVMLSNSREYLILRYAMSCAGLIEAALNPEHRGAVLERMLVQARPEALIVDDARLPQIESCKPDLTGIPVILESELADLCQERKSWEERPKIALGPGSIARIIFTSGTTGGSKGAQLSHAYEVFTGERIIHRIGFGPDDRWLYVTPFFHVDALIVIAALLHTGGAFVLAPNFSLSRFWEDVRCSGATSFVYVGTILALLLKGGDPPAGHSLRSAVGGGCPITVWEEFERRFGATIVEAYAMTECIACTMNWRDHRRIGSAGKPHEGYEVAIVDGFDRPLPPGQAGEIVIRSTEPWAFMSGYLNADDATVASQRNFWFHTGDLGVLDEEGWLYYRGRLKDVIRRRGENISAEELEDIANKHPSVMVSAAIGVPSSMGEEDVLLYVQTKPGVTFDPATLCDFIASQAASFMVPLYVAVIDEMPFTPTQKVAKTMLPQKAGPELWTNPQVRR
jgi:carnitine-CoA ligase